MIVYNIVPKTFLYLKWSYGKYLNSIINVGDTPFFFLIIEETQYNKSSSKSIIVGYIKYSKKTFIVSSIISKNYPLKWSCSAINLIVFQHLFILIFALLSTFFFIYYLALIFNVFPPFLFGFPTAYFWLFISFYILITNDDKKIFKLSTVKFE